MKTSYFRKFAFVFFILLGLSFFVDSMTTEIFFFKDILTVINFPSSIFYNFAIEQSSGWWQSTFFEWIDNSIGSTFAFVVMVLAQSFLITTFITIIFQRRGI